jgi:hypothetical protein
MILVLRLKLFKNMATSRNVKSSLKKERISTKNENVSRLVQNRNTHLEDVQEKEEAQVAPKAIKSTKAYVSSKVAVKPAGNNKGIKCNAKPFALGVKRRKKPVQSFGKFINHQNYVKTVN